MILTLYHTGSSSIFISFFAQLTVQFLDFTKYVPSKFNRTLFFCTLHVGVFLNPYSNLASGVSVNLDNPGLIAHTVST